jgi:hypothetical protein
VADAALARAARRVVGLICGGARSSSTSNALAHSGRGFRTSAAG